MPIYEYDFEIESKKEAEADEKMKALTFISTVLTAKELTKLAHTLKYDPITTALAKLKLGL